MEHINTAECLQTLTLAQDATDLARMQLAAEETQGVTVEPLPNQTDEYGEYAESLNAYRLREGYSGIINKPEAWASTADRIQHAGGFVVKLVADQSSGDGHPETKAYFARLKAYRNPQSRNPYAKVRKVRK